jgi:hypothetical protein
VRATDIGEDVHYGLWGFDIVQPGKWLPVFWRNMLPPSAERMKILPEKNLIPVAVWRVLTWAAMWHFFNPLFMLAGIVTRQFCQNFPIFRLV